MTKCIHRHTIKTHPNCFKTGKVLEVTQATYDKKVRVEKTFVKPRKRVNIVDPDAIPWYQVPGTRIGYFDIEADGLKANFATMLSWAVKEKGKKTVCEVISKEDLFDGTRDRELVRSCIAELKKYDIIVTYYGTGYDLPFMRSKALYWYQVTRKKLQAYYEKKSLVAVRRFAKAFGLQGSRLNKADLITLILDYNPELLSLEFPEYGTIVHFDLYYLIRAKFNLSRKSLAVATQYFGIEGKTPLSGLVWSKAKYGHKESLDEVVVHNIEDVKILEELHDLIACFRKWTRRSI